MLNFFHRALKNEKGFTLIEVLVVVAIIGILVALAAPRVIRRIDDARLAADEATAKVLNDAILGLELDADKREDYDATWDTGEITWGELQEFLDDTNVVTPAGEANDETKIGTGIVLIGKSRNHTIVATAPETGGNDSKVWKFLVVPNDESGGEDGEEGEG
jgi:prepilin-type N-terminal cleavage/methylation domain-containing protein